MAVVVDKEDSSGKRTKETLKRLKRKKKTTEPIKTKKIHKCSKCSDSGTVISTSGKAIKCSCIIESEIKGWLDVRIKQAMRGYSPQLNLKASPLDNEDLLFNGVSSKQYLKTVGKHLLERYFRNGMNTYDYKLMTGNDYTEHYVIGDHTVYHNVSELYIMLGFDNFNKTLGTTIYSLINERQLKGLKTWTFVPDTSKSTASILDLYGQHVLDYIKDKDNFYKIISKGK